MSWSYNPDLKDIVSQIRFNIGDTDKDNPLFQDEEIQFVYDKKNSVPDASYQCIRHLVNKYAREIDYQIGPEKVWAQQAYDHYRDLLKLWEKETQSNNGPLGFGISSEATPFIFHVGMHDNWGGV